MSVIRSLFGRQGTAVTVKDPVCGMSVDPTRARWTSEYRGAAYHFCAKRCKAAFDARPAEYAT